LPIVINIATRFASVLGDRRPNTWAKDCNLSSAHAHRFVHGGNIGAEILVLIQRKENVSLSWLLDGKGAPYLINYAPNLGATCAVLGAMLEQCPQWQIINIQVGDNSPAFLLVRNNLMWRKGPEPIHYIEVEVVCGPPEGLEPLLVDRFAALSERPAKYILADSLFYSRLCGGLVGSHEIISNYGVNFDLAPAEQEWPVFSADDLHQDFYKPPLGEKTRAFEWREDQARQLQLYKRWSSLPKEKQRALETIMDLAAPAYEGKERNE